MSYFLLTLLFLSSTFLNASSKHTILSLTHKLSKMPQQNPTTTLKTLQKPIPLTSGSDYTLRLSISGSPLTLYMDTGSDLVWSPCTPFECILCENKPDLPNVISKFTPHNSTKVSCSQPSCSLAHNNASPRDLCAISHCPLDQIETSDCQRSPCPDFYYAYGDGSLVGRLFTDSLTLGKTRLQNFTFGCARTALGESVGIAGFGRGPLSLPGQLGSKRFSYCLVAHSLDPIRIRVPSPLVLWRDETLPSPFVHTPMLRSPSHPYLYLVGLESVSVGKRVIETPRIRQVNQNGDGGLAIDSGTTYTMLPSGIFESLVTEFDRQTEFLYKRAGPSEVRVGLSPCYYILTGNNTVPSLTLHFGGNSSVVLPRRNYFYEFLDGAIGRVGCLMLMDGGDDFESGGPGGILGNYQQQGFEVLYDLERRTVGFGRRKCASLWRNLNRG